MNYSHPSRTHQHITAYSYKYVRHFDISIRTHSLTQKHAFTYNHTCISTTCVVTYNHTCISTTCVVSAPAGCLWCGTPGLSLNAPCAGVAVVPPSSSNRDGRNESVPLTKSSCKTLHRPPFMRTSKRSVCPPATPSLPYLGMQQNPTAAANVGVCWLPSSLRGADSKSQSSEDHTCFDLHQCY